MEGRQEQYLFSPPQQATAKDELVIQTPVREGKDICQIDGLEDTSEDDSEPDEESSAESNMSGKSGDSTNEESETSDKDDVPKPKKRRKEQNVIDNNQDPSSHKELEDIHQTEYFRHIAEIEEDILAGPKDIPIYLGNLKESQGFKVLRDGYISLADCDNINNLKKITGRKYSFCEGCKV